MHASEAVSARLDRDQFQVVEVLRAARRLDGAVGRDQDLGGAEGADRGLDRGGLGVVDLGRQLRLGPPCGVVVTEELQDDRPFEDRAVLGRELLRFSGAWELVPPVSGPGRLPPRQGPFVLMSEGG